MYAQRSPRTPRSNSYGRNAYQRPPVRARIGLVMRRSQNFGPLGDAEPALRNTGLSLAPLSIDDAAMNTGGVTVLPTAEIRDIDNGALKALVVPGGAPESEAGEAALKDAVGRALAKGAPVLAFGEGVVAALRAADRSPGDYADAPAVMIQAEGVTPLADLDAVADLARTIG